MREDNRKGQDVTFGTPYIMNCISEALSQEQIRITWHNVWKSQTGAFVEREIDFVVTRYPVVVEDSDVRRERGGILQL